MLFVNFFAENFLIGRIFHESKLGSLRNFSLTKFLVSQGVRFLVET